MEVIRGKEWAKPFLSGVAGAVGASFLFGLDIFDK